MDKILALLALVAAGCVGSGNLSTEIETDGGFTDAETGGAAGTEEGSTTIVQLGSGGEPAFGVDAGGDGDGDGDGDGTETNFLTGDILAGEWMITRTITLPQCNDVTPPEPTTVEHGVVITSELLMHYITDTESVYWEAGRIEGEVWYPDAAMAWSIWSNPEVTAVDRNLLRGTAVHAGGRCALNTWAFELVRML